MLGLSNRLAGGRGMTDTSAKVDIDILTALNRDYIASVQKGNVRNMKADSGETTVLRQRAPSMAGLRPCPPSGSGYQRLKCGVRSQTAGRP
jgi:hypothetical protein